MTGTINKRASIPDVKRSSDNFAQLMTYVANLYCANASSSVSSYEAHELTLSVSYTLDIVNATFEEAALVLDVDDPIALWRDAVDALDKRMDAALVLWNEVVTTMPPIHSVALRDTLASLSTIKSRYSIYFAAHEIPCDIDYQLSEPVDPSLMGIDYIEAWLTQLLLEVRWIAQFDVDSCIDVLERACPDYRGLHVNLYDVLLPHVDELVPIDTSVAL